MKATPALYSDDAVIEKLEPDTFTRPAMMLPVNERLLEPCIFAVPLGAWMMPSHDPPLPERSRAELELASEKKSTPVGSSGAGDSVKLLPETCNSPRATNVTSPVMSEPESCRLPSEQYVPGSRVVASIQMPLSLPRFTSLLTFGRS